MPRAAAPKKSAPKKAKKKSTSAVSSLRRTARIVVGGVVLVFALLCAGGLWYVHHPADWLAEHDSFLTSPLRVCGDGTAFFTDALGWTGHDAVYESDDPPPANQILFAGAPVRTGAPAPADIQILHRGEFIVGWSPSLRHPVWVAYHVPTAERFPAEKEPRFQKDVSVANAPAPADYAKSRYDRAPLVPSRMLATRFGGDEQKKAFKMSAVAPQLPTLHRGPWNELEQRLTDLWPAAYGELWVVAGALSTRPGAQKIPGTAIDVPDAYYMVVAAQAADGVRAFAVLLPQTIDRWAFPVHNLLTIDELEAKTGLDFFPDLPKYLQRPLEADRPTRLWPVRLRDVFKLLLARFT